MLERVPRRVRGQQRGRAAGARDAIDQRLLLSHPEGVARRGVGQHDHRGAHLPERLRRLVETLAVRAGALLHARRAARRPLRGWRLQAGEVEAHARRRHPVALGLHRGIARRHQEADPRAPAEHQAGGVAAPAGPSMRTKLATSPGLWKVPTRSVSTLTANSRERARA